MIVPRTGLVAVVVVGLLGSAGLLCPPAAAFELNLREGSRVVFIGGTVIEREQTYGCWETMLTTHWPQRNVTFRNLGWSADTVWGESRDGFETATEGFKRLVDLTLALKPTHIVIGYGNNEAYAGEAGLKRFIEGYTALLDALQPAGAQLIMLAPLDRETLPPPLPDAKAYNHGLWHYRDALHELSVRRDHAFIDLEPWLAPQREANSRQFLTENGTHLSAMGYLITAAGLENDCRLAPAGWKVELDAAGKVTHVVGTRVTEVVNTADGMSFQLQSERLPFTAAVREPGRAGVLRVAGLAAGNYRLMVDSRPILTASAAEWDRGAALDPAGESQQIDELRATIVKKNELYFHRWRPQNMTYLFGFRKHEQGKNAAEIVQFDPLIAAEEAKIAELRVPQPHSFKLVRVVPPK